MADISLQMYRTQRVTVFAEPVLDNLEAPLVSTPIWSQDTNSYSTILPSTDGLSCVVTANGVVGVVNVTCTALGQTSLSGVVQISIITDYANALVLSTSVPVPQ